MKTGHYWSMVFKGLIGQIINMAFVASKYQHNPAVDALGP